MSLQTLDGQQSHLPFKGSRKYLTGADIYYWIDDLLGKTLGGFESLAISFRRLTGFQIVIRPLDEVEKSPGLTGDFSVIILGETHRFGLVESDVPVADSVPYDEDGLIRDCVMVDQTIAAPAVLLPCTTVDLAVAMTKALHKALFPEETRKWLFVRLEMSRSFRAGDRETLKISMIHNLQKRFSKLLIESSGGPIGTIYFSTLG